MEEKIFIYFDTNFIKHSGKDIKLEAFTINNNLDRIVKTEWSKNIEFIVPEVVLREITHQLYRKYNDIVEMLKKKFSNEFIFDKLEEPEKYLERVEIEAYEYFKYKNIKILPLSESINIKELLDNALKSNKPFGGKNPSQKTDAGFKDAMIVESIKYNENNNRGKHLFVTNDGDMDGLLQVLKVTNTDEFENKLAIHKIFNITTTKEYILEKLASEKSFDKTKVNILFKFEEDISYFTVRFEDGKIKKGNCKLTDGVLEVEFIESDLEERGIVNE